MWNSVVIGEGNKGCSAVHLFKIAGEHGISHNNVSYWIHDCMLGFDLTVFKNTDEGKTITEFVEREYNSKVIYKYCNSILLKYVEYEQAQTQIEHALNAAYNRGKTDKIQEILNVLGI
jgi:hypothetical protein